MNKAPEAARRRDVTLADFLAARLGEIDGAARAADQRRWLITETADAHAVVYVSRPEPSSAATVLFEADWGTLADAAHIALHNPQRALREVEAMRFHLARYFGALETQRRRPDDEGNNGYIVAMSQVIKDDARIWADHPFYKEEWRP